MDNWKDVMKVSPVPRMPDTTLDLDSKIERSGLPAGALQGTIADLLQLGRLVGDGGAIYLDGINKEIRANDGRIDRVIINQNGIKVYDANGNLTIDDNGFSALYVVKSGDTMTGDLDLNDNALKFGTNYEIYKDGVNLVLKGDADSGGRLAFDAGNQDNGLLSSFVNWNRSSVGTAGTGYLMSSGNVDDFIGGIFSRRKTGDSLNSIIGARVFYGGILSGVTLTDPKNIPFYIEGFGANSAARYATSNFNSNVIIQNRNIQTTDVSLMVKGVSSQTSNLQEWKDSLNNTIAYISSAGDVSCKGLTTSGGEIKKITTVTNTYTVLVTDYTVICNKATPFTVTLPTAVVGQIFNIKNIGAGIVTVDGESSDTIDGELTQSVNQLECLTIQCYEANKWAII